MDLASDLAINDADNALPPLSISSAQAIKTTRAGHTQRTSREWRHRQAWTVPARGTRRQQDHGIARHPFFSTTDLHAAEAASNAVSFLPVGGIPVVSPVWAFTKRLMDVVAGILLLATLSPLMLVVVALVAVSGRQIMFRQQRVGLHGRLFTMYKFRTMVPNAEAVLMDILRNNPSLREEWRQKQKLSNDPRITGVGTWLRKLSLDELPQLFNVIRGDMSLVGPRPVLSSELQRYGRAARWYLAARPGITGLWQVNGRCSTGYSRRIAMDVHYVRRQRVWIDFLILLKTPLAVLLREGAQ